MTTQFYRTGMSGLNRQRIKKRNACPLGIGNGTGMPNRKSAYTSNNSNSGTRRRTRKRDETPDDKGKKMTTEPSTHEKLTAEEAWEMRQLEIPTKREKLKRKNDKNTWNMTSGGNP